MKMPPEEVLENYQKIFPDYKRCNKCLKQNEGVYFKRIQE